MFCDDTLRTTKNKLGIYRLFRRMSAYPGNKMQLTEIGNKKAAPLGAAVIATLNHITGLTLHGSNFGGMG